MRYWHSWPAGYGRRAGVSFSAWWLLPGCLGRLLLWGAFWLFIGWWAWLTAEVLLLLASLAVLIWCLARYGRAVSVTVLRLRWGLIAFDTAGNNPG